MNNRIEELLNSANFGHFTPYVEFHEEADAITAYFKDEPDFSRRLTDHVTLYLSQANQEIVGCRIKGVRDILENLPNYLTIDHDSVRLSMLFLPYYASVSGEQREKLNELARASQSLRIPAVAK